MKKSPSLLIVDSNDMFRRTLRDIIQREIPSLQVSEAQNADEGLKMAIDKQPEWIVTDLHLDKGSSLSMIREITSLRPEASIAVLTDMDEEEYRKAALEKGADYFVSKSGSNGHSLLSIIQGHLLGTIE